LQGLDLKLSCAIRLWYGGGHRVLIRNRIKLLGYRSVNIGHTETCGLFSHSVKLETVIMRRDQMTSRERVLCAMRLEEPDKLPWIEEVVDRKAVFP